MYSNHLGEVAEGLQELPGHPPRVVVEDADPPESLHIVQPLEEPCEGPAHPEVGAVARDLLGEQVHLHHPRRGEGFGLLEDDLQGTGAEPAPEAGDDAEGAGARAALGHFQVGARVGLGEDARQAPAVVHQGVREGLPGGEGAFGPRREKFGQAVVLAGSDEKVHLGKALGELPAVALGQAARHHEGLETARLL